MAQFRPPPGFEPLESRTLLSATPATAIALNIPYFNGDMWGAGGNVEAGRSNWFVLEARRGDFKLHLHLGEGYAAVSQFLYRDINDNREVNRGEGMATQWVPGIDGTGEELWIDLAPGRYFLQVRNDTAAPVIYGLSYGARYLEVRPLDDWWHMAVGHQEHLVWGTLTYPTYGHSLEPDDTTNLYRFELSSPQAVDILTHYRTTNDDLYYFDGGDVYVPAVQPAPAPVGANPAVELIADFDGDSRIDPGEVLDTGNQIVRTLPAGVYFLRVSGQIPADHPYLPYVVVGKGFDSTMGRMPLAAEWDGLKLVTPAQRPTGVFRGSLPHNTSHFYKLAVSKRTGLRAVLSAGSLQNADLQVIRDADGDGRVDAGEILASSARRAGLSDMINLVLNPGTYFVRALNVSGKAADYKLTLSGIFAPPTDPGIGFTTAFNTGAYASGQAFMDSMIGADNRDYYRFTLAASRTVKLSLASLGGDANFELLHDKNGNGVRDDGELVASSANTGTTADTITAALAPGTYYVRVYRVGDANSLYQLKFE